MSICYIFGSGEYGPEWPVPAAGDFLIAADGGYATLGSHGLIPDLLVGDFDSLGYVPDHPHIVRHPVEKDDTDVALALREGWARGFREFRIYGGLGGRLDHTVANLQLLAGLARQGGAGYLLGENTVITALTAGRLEFPAEYRGILSVFAVGGPADGVTLTGVKYPLDGSKLTPEIPLGVSNEFLGGPAAVAVGKGTLLVMWSPRDGAAMPKRTIEA